MDSHGRFRQEEFRGGISLTAMSPFPRSVRRHNIARADSARAARSDAFSGRRLRDQAIADALNARGIATDYSAQAAGVGLVLLRDQRLPAILPARDRFTLPCASIAA
jgi:hypothetical protein